GGGGKADQQRQSHRFQHERFPLLRRQTYTSPLAPARSPIFGLPGRFAVNNQLLKPCKIRIAAAQHYCFSFARSSLFSSQNDSPAYAGQDKEDLQCLPASSASSANGSATTKASMS